MLIVGVVLIQATERPQARGVPSTLLNEIRPISGQGEESKRMAGRRGVKNNVVVMCLQIGVDEETNGHERKIL